MSKNKSARSHLVRPTLARSNLQHCALGGGICNVPPERSANLHRHKDASYSCQSLEVASATSHLLGCSRSSLGMSIMTRSPQRVPVMLTADLECSETKSLPFEKALDKHIL